MKLSEKIKEKFDKAKAKKEVAKAKKEKEKDNKKNNDPKKEKSKIKKIFSSRTKRENAEKKLHKIKSKTIISKFDKKKVIKKRRFSKLLDEFIEKSGHDIKQKILQKRLFLTTMILTVLLFATFIIYALLKTLPLKAFLITGPAVLILGFALFFILIWISVFVYFDFKVAQRTRQIEDVLPDFLQLASANISAGMPIDRALWFAVRPRFGVLAKEMEEIAKSTITGSELDEALIKFTQKYKSRLLRESVNLIIAGLKSGGELGDLLNKISHNIQQTKMMRKEISASVMTYVIFIGVASVLAAPLLFALSSQLLGVVTSISGDFDSSSLEDLPSGSSPMTSFSFGGESIKSSDFKIFSLVLMAITSFFAAAIIGVIQKGDAKSAIIKFPIFFTVSMIIFNFSSFFLGKLLGGLMG